MRTRSLLACGVLAGPVFVGTFAVAGRRQPGYVRSRQAVSELARQRAGWVQTVNFFATGALAAAGAVGTRRSLRTGAGSAAVPVLVGAIGAGFVGAGIFATDTPEESARTGLSRRGALHVASAVPVFVGLPLACLVGARRLAAEGHRRWAALSATTAVLSISAATAAGTGFAGGRRTSARAGTYQRVAIVSGLAWLSAFSAWLAWRRPPPETDD